MKPLVQGVPKISALVPSFQPSGRARNGYDLKKYGSKRIGSRYVSGRTRAWLKTKNPQFQRI